MVQQTLAITYVGLMKSVPVRMLISFNAVGSLFDPFSVHLEHCRQKEKQQILLLNYCVGPAYPNICYSEASVWSLLLSFFICSNVLKGVVFRAYTWRPSELTVPINYLYYLPAYAGIRGGGVSQY